MKRMILLTGVVLLALGTKSMANELDELGEIQIVDESAKSTLFQKGKIVGCTDYGTKKELSCSKKPKDAILSKLPTSQQLNDADLSDDDDSEAIKDKLLEIIKELKELKEEQKENRATIKELKSLVAVFSEKKTTASKKKIIKKGIKKIEKKKSAKTKSTRIRQAIKEISRTDNEVIIEVQNNESLSTYAQAYYNDNTKYYKIYKANKDKIPESLQIVIGTHLRIPLN